MAEFIERGCTNTLYFHGFSCEWFGECLPIQLGDEVGEADLYLAKGLNWFAPLWVDTPCTFVSPRPLRISTLSCEQPHVLHNNTCRHLREKQ